MIFQIYKSNPAVKQLFPIPFQNGFYDVKLIRIDNYFTNAGANGSSFLISDRLFNNSKEFRYVAGQPTVNVPGLFFYNKSVIMENANWSTFFNSSFQNEDLLKEFSWSNVYLDGYLDLAVYAGTLTGSNTDSFNLYVANPNMLFFVFTFDITPTDKKLNIKDYLKL